MEYYYCPTEQDDYDGDGDDGGDLFGGVFEHDFWESSETIKKKLNQIGNTRFSHCNISLCHVETQNDRIIIITIIIARRFHKLFYRRVA